MSATSAHSRLSSDPESRPQAARLVALTGLILALAYLIVLGGAYRNGQFLTDPQGQPIANDFVNVYAAGRLTLDGTPAAAYDWPVHKTAEERAVGHAFANYYGWHYPPMFLFVAAALALAPYLTAAVIWLAATLAAFAATLGSILGGRVGVFLALGFPAALWNVTAGQNGFLTATLIGGTLGLLERHPALAGRLPRASVLQAAIRPAVSACADRRPALADACRRGFGRGRPRRAGMACLRQRQLACVRRQRAGHQPRHSQ